MSVATNVLLPLHVSAHVIVPHDAGLIPFPFC